MTYVVDVWFVSEYWEYCPEVNGFWFVRDTSSL